MKVDIDLVCHDVIMFQLEYKWITGRGPKPGECIVRIAKEQGASMIIMGARGQSKL